MPPLWTEEDLRKRTCGEKARENFARGLTFGLVASTIMLDVRGYATAVYAFSTGSFPDPKKMFPIIARVAQRTFGFGAFCGIYTLIRCTLDGESDGEAQPLLTKLGLMTGNPNPPNAAIAVGLAASVGGTIMYSGNLDGGAPANVARRVMSRSLALSGLAYTYHHAKENMNMQIAWNFNDPPADEN